MKHYKFFAISYAAFILSLGISCSALASTKLILSDIIDQRPSSIIAQRVLIHAYKQLGIEVKFVELPNLRTKKLLEEKVIDGVVFRLVDSQVTDLKKIPIPITYEELVVFSVNKKFKVAGYQSLSPYSVGYLSGAKIFEDHLQGMQIDTAPNIESLFRKLEAGRTDIVLESRSSFCQAKKLGLNNIVILEPSLEKILGYHWLSQRHANLFPRLESILRKMQHDGIIQKIQGEVWNNFNTECTKF